MIYHLIFSQNYNSLIQLIKRWNKHRTGFDKIFNAKSSIQNEKISKNIADNHVSTLVIF